MLYALIIAGGSGKRLWPKSVRGNPKFFLKVNSKKTLLEQAIDRAKQVMPVGNIMIVTSTHHVNLIHKLLPKFPRKNIISEPLSRNTAPAVCVGAALIEKKDPNSVVYVMPADQIIEDINAIRQIFTLSALIARIKDSIITIGIRPGFASTGYGYIKTAKLYKSLKSDFKYDVFEVGRFTEKPDIKRAKNFIATKKYLWNSGIFIGKAGVLLNEFKTHCPEVYKTAVKIADSKGEKGLRNALKHYYRYFPDISIDYAVMEKTDKALVISADPGWSDIGSWNVFQRYLAVDQNKNAVGAEHICINTKRSIIIADKGHLIATVGVSDLIVVHAPHATLICSKSCPEDVKKIVDLAGKQGLKRYL
jgi:mannose-1-phosphate guanylyltransferase